MLIRFDGKTVIVAGAARGIGRAIARAFAADGATVIACDRLVDQIEAGERIKALPVDVTDAASIDKVVAAAGSYYGTTNELKRRAKRGEDPTNRYAGLSPDEATPLS